MKGDKFRGAENEVHLIYTYTLLKNVFTSKYLLSFVAVIFLPNGPLPGPARNFCARAKRQKFTFFFRVLQLVRCSRSPRIYPFRDSQLCAEAHLEHRIVGEKADCHVLLAECEDSNEQNSSAFYPNGTVVV